jgi:hypothetical protein
MIRFWTQFRLVYELTSGMMSNKFQIRDLGQAHWKSVPGVERGGISDETKLELGSVDRRVAGFPRSG